MCVKKKGKKIISVCVFNKTPSYDSHLSLIRALTDIGKELDCKVNIKWPTLDGITNSGIKEVLDNTDGIIVTEDLSFPSEKERILKYARQNRIPTLGISFGCQLMAIEFAKNACGVRNATSEELSSSKNLLVKLTEKKVGGFYTIIKNGSSCNKIYGKGKIRERHRHSSEINPHFKNILEENGMKISGKREDGQIDIIEVATHPFYIGVQFHPEYLSRPLSPDPLLLKFVHTCKVLRWKKTKL